jgi:aryl-alcohol dehydrogenase-like predicted oxidoreductase
MKYVNLGRSGMKVSRIALGCMSYSIDRDGWFLSEEQSLDAMRRAIELGINFFDTANMYGKGQSEIVTGRAVQRFARREDMVLATKVYFPMSEAANGAGLSRKAIMGEVEASLRRLGTDYVDLYQIHRWDYSTPIDETLEALHDLVRSGKVRYVGASSMFAWQFCKALHLADLRGWSRFVSMQPHYNLINREEEREMIPLCREEGVAVLPWSPLARGRLTRASNATSSSGRPAHDETARALYDGAEAHDQRVLDRLGELAASRDLPRAQLALAWLLHKPGVTAPIIGATKASHLPDAIAALDVTLSEHELLQLEELYAPHGVVGYS